MVLRSKYVNRERFVRTNIAVASHIQPAQKPEADSTRSLQRERRRGDRILLLDRKQSALPSLFDQSAKLMSNNTQTAPNMSSVVTPCGACKFLRRKCTKTCVFAPYFPPDQGQKFANVHKVFGASNIAKLLQDLPERNREDAVNSLSYEADARVSDPIYGCVGSLFSLQQQVTRLQSELSSAQAELARFHTVVGPQNSDRTGLQGGILVRNGLVPTNAAGMAVPLSLHPSLYNMGGGQEGMVSQNGNVIIQQSQQPHITHSQVTVQAIDVKPQVDALQSQRQAQGLVQIQPQVHLMSVPSQNQMFQIQSGQGTPHGQLVQIQTSPQGQVIQVPSQGQLLCLHQQTQMLPQSQMLQQQQQQQQQVQVQQVQVQSQMIQAQSQGQILQSQSQMMQAQVQSQVAQSQPQTQGQMMQALASSQLVDSQNQMAQMQAQNQMMEVQSQLVQIQAQNQMLETQNQMAQMQGGGQMDSQAALAQIQPQSQLVDAQSSLAQMQAQNQIMELQNQLAHIQAQNQMAEQAQNHLAQMQVPNNNESHSQLSQIQNKAQVLDAQGSFLQMHGQSQMEVQSQSGGQAQVLDQMGQSQLVQETSQVVQLHSQSQTESQNHLLQMQAGQNQMMLDPQGQLSHMQVQGQMMEAQNSMFQMQPASQMVPMQSQSQIMESQNQIAQIQVQNQMIETQMAQIQAQNQLLEVQSQMIQGQSQMVHTNGQGQVMQAQIMDASGAQVVRVPSQTHLVSAGQPQLAQAAPASPLLAGTAGVQMMSSAGSDGMSFDSSTVFAASLLDDSQMNYDRGQCEPLQPPDDV